MLGGGEQGLSFMCRGMDTCKSWKSEGTQHGRNTKEKHFGTATVYIIGGMLFPPPYPPPPKKDAKTLSWLGLPAWRKSLGAADVAKAKAEEGMYNWND